MADDKGAPTGGLRNCDILISEVAGSLARRMLERCQALEKPWHNLSEKEQNAYIGQFKLDAWTMVSRIAHTVAGAAGEWPVLPVTLKKISISGDKVEGAVSFSSDEKTIIEAAKATGHHALLVVAEEAPFMRGFEAMRADADQHLLPGIEPASTEETGQEGASEPAGGLDFDTGGPIAEGEEEEQEEPQAAAGAAN